MSDPMSDPQPCPFDRDLYVVYQDGKMKRYTLFFAVNGGAFAILKIPVEHGQNELQWFGNVFLSEYMPWGMVLFSILMFVDIWNFGWLMRREGLSTYAFKGPGQAILMAITALIMTGWLLLANRNADALHLAGWQIQQNHRPLVLFLLCFLALSGFNLLHYGLARSKEQAA